MSSSDRRLQVLVAGGGVAGLEALLALRDLAGDRVATTLLSPDDEFVYRPMTTAEPFARGHAQRHRLSAIAERLDVPFHRGALAAVDDAARAATTAAGERLPYDALLVAVGARSGVAIRAAMTWTPEHDPEVFGGLLRDLEEGYTKRVAFVVPPGNAWPLPAYELALMTAWDAYDMGMNDVEVTIYTPEDAPLGLFGPAASAALRDDLDAARVRVEPGTFVAEADGRLIAHPGGQPLPADRVVALPAATGPAIAGLPADRLGFVLTDLHGRVPDMEAVWAAGDAIAFPIKQGGLAAQQADAVAASIAAAAGAPVEPRPFHPVLRGVVLTGRGRQWLRRDIGGGGDDSEAERHALFWPPTKVAGRYLAPFLFELDEARELRREPEPDGQAVELDLARDVPAAADALRLARLRDRADRADFALRRAEEHAQQEVSELQRELDTLADDERRTEQQLRERGYLRDRERDDAS